MDRFVVTCEHGGNQIPEQYRPLFSGQRALLDSHRGWDPGALTMARALAASWAAPLVSSTTSRLLIDLNRSIGHRQLFSAATRAAPAAIRQHIVEQHYQPYRDRVHRVVHQAVSAGYRVIHISSHSFTPELDGDVRTADVGLLYDPRRPPEAVVAARCKHALAASSPTLRVRRNYPYAGSDDGLTTELRRRFTSSQYVGIELEVNQDLAVAGPRWTALRGTLIDSLHTACAS